MQVFPAFSTLPEIHVSPSVDVHVAPSDLERSNPRHPTVTYRPAPTATPVIRAFFVADCAGAEVHPSSGAELTVAGVAAAVAPGEGAGAKAVARGEAGGAANDVWTGVVRPHPPRTTMRRHAVAIRKRSITNLLHLIARSSPAPDETP
jgi:hypothetical protein